MRLRPAYSRLEFRIHSKFHIRSYRRLSRLAHRAVSFDRPLSITVRNLLVCLGSFASMLSPSACRRQSRVVVADIYCTQPPAQPENKNSKPALHGRHPPTVSSTGRVEGGEGRAEVTRGKHGSKSTSLGIGGVVALVVYFLWREPTEDEFIHGLFHVQFRASMIPRHSLIRALF